MVFFVWLPMMALLFGTPFIAVEIAEYNSGSPIGWACVLLFILFILSFIDFYMQGREAPRSAGIYDLGDYAFDGAVKITIVAIIFCFIVFVFMFDDFSEIFFI